MAMGSDDSGMGFLHCVKFCSESAGFDEIGSLVNMSYAGTRSADEQRGFSAPFPDEAHKAGAQGQPHITIKGAGHFLQEQSPGELASAARKLIADNPS